MNKLYVVKIFAYAILNTWVRSHMFVFPNFFLLYIKSFKEHNYKC